MEADLNIVMSMLRNFEWSVIEFLEVVPWYPLTWIQYMKWSFFSALLHINYYVVFISSAIFLLLSCLVNFVLFVLSQVLVD